MVEERELLAGKVELPLFRTDFRDARAWSWSAASTTARPARSCAPTSATSSRSSSASTAGQRICEEGFKPDMIVGDMDSASPETLACGAELVVHAYPDGTARAARPSSANGLGYKDRPRAGHQPGHRELTPTRRARG